MTVQTIKLTWDQKKRLREIARELGYTIGRGAEKDWGSINQLASAIADGHVVLSVKNGNHE